MFFAGLSGPITSISSKMLAEYEPISLLWKSITSLYHPAQEQGSSLNYQALLLFHALLTEQHKCLCHIFWSRGVYKTNHWAFSFSKADKHSRMTILSSSVKNIIAITEPVKCSSVITYLTQSLSFALSVSPLTRSLSLSIKPKVSEHPHSHGFTYRAVLSSPLLFWENIESRWR